LEARAETKRIAKVERLGSAALPSAAQPRTLLL
jgi:hypothetical protein